MNSKPEISPETSTTKEHYSEDTLKSEKSPQTRAQKIVGQHSKQIAKLLQELDEIALKEKQIYSFYANEIATFNQIYCTEMAQYISRLDQSYEEGSHTHKRKAALGDIILNSSLLLTDINKEMYEESMKPYIYKYREIQHGISFKQQDREDIPFVAETLEAIYNVELIKEANMAKNVESFLQTAYQKISLQLNKEEKEQMAAYTNRKMTKQDWEREFNRQEGIFYAQIMQERILTQLFIKKSEAAKRARIEKEFNKTLEACQKTGAFTLLRMQLNWIKESETGKVELPDEKLSEYNRRVQKLLQRIENEITRITTTPLPGLPTEYELLLKTPTKKLPDKLEKLKARAKKRLKNSLYLSECIGGQKAINQYIDALIKDMELEISPEFRIEKE